MNTLVKQTAQSLTPRQNAFLRAYTEPTSSSFGNCYQAAMLAGYSDQTARNLTHLKPVWLSENIGQVLPSTITPDEIMAKLTGIIEDNNEPTIIKLKALEMTMKAYSMLVQQKDTAPKTVSINIDLTGGNK